VSCSNREKARATRSHLFESHVNFSCVLIVPILTNSYRMNPVKRAVLACSIPKRWLIRMKVRRSMMIFFVPIIPISHASDLLMIGSSFFLGGFSIIFGVAGSSPSAMAGSPSVNRFIHRI